MSRRTPPKSTRRPRRLRRSEALRALVRETRVTPAQLVQPIFLIEGEAASHPIESMGGVERVTVDRAVTLVRRGVAAGVASFALFPVVADERKSPGAEEALRVDNLIGRAAAEIKSAVPHACVITDVALDPYSSVGHDGLVVDGEVANDATVRVLSEMAVAQARAGADVVAPSDMMDGRVAAIRCALDAAGFTSVAIMSYAAKYASSLYGPFREALDSAPVDLEGVPPDKKTYQMDPSNAREALVEASLDESEGADILLIKPAGWYLDVIARVRVRTDLPVAAYQVSGEYAMLRGAAAQGWIEWEAAYAESLAAIVRAGADIVVTYGAVEYAERLA
ncbi:MAG: porphobilinogen synthase [Planctomycetota bacterium]